MGLFDVAKEVVSGLVHSLTADWWVEVTTINPAYTYYFGPFDTVEEAEAAQAGYIEDLALEGAQEITAEVKRCSPQEITIAHSA